jgi:hypothetical protein
MAPHAQCELARLDALHGDFAGAQARLDRVIAGDEPSLRRMATIYSARLRMWRGDLDGAIAIARPEGADIAGAFSMFFADLARSRSLDEGSWRTWFGRMTVEGAAMRGRLFAAQILSEAALLFARDDLALEALAWGVDHGFKDLYWWDHCPLVRRLDGEPRAAALRVRIEAQARRIAAAYRRGLEG